MSKALVLALITLGLVVSPSWGRTIVFGTDATWPPMEFLDSNNNFGGFAVDYVRAAAKEAGFTAQFSFTDWNNLFAGLARGDFDAVCSSVSVTPRRAKNMDFSQPYFTVHQVLVVPADSPVKNLAELSGREVGVLTDTTGQLAASMTPGVVIRPYGYAGLAFEVVLAGASSNYMGVLLRQQLIWLMEDLMSGRLGGVVCDDVVAGQLVDQTPRFQGKLRIASPVEALGVENYALAVRKGDQATQALLNTGLAKVRAKGLDRELAHKWLAR